MDIEAFLDEFESVVVACLQLILKGYLLFKKEGRCYTAEPNDSERTQGFAEKQLSIGPPGSNHYFHGLRRIPFMHSVLFGCGFRFAPPHLEDQPVRNTLLY